MKINVHATSIETLRSLTNAFIETIKTCKSKPFHLALPGGSFAQMLFKFWTKNYRDRIPWEIIHFYWIDEQCVSPESEESNFKHAEQLLFRPLQISQDHVHRIWGEKDPNIEAERYSEIVKWELPGYSDTPRFDCIILNIESDGHVASIFNSSMNLLTDQRVYAVSQHPQNKQMRITMTGTVILKSTSLLISIIGAEKQTIMKHLVHKKGIYPASYILNHATTAILFTDQRVE